MTIGYIAYWQTPNPTWFGNVGQFLGSIEMWIVLGFMLWSLYRKGELAIEFEGFQKLCLILALGIICVWERTNRADIAFWLFQALLVLSYVAVVEKLIQWNKNHDDVMMWFAIFIMSFLSLVPAGIDGDKFGLVSAIRGILSSGITVVIMLRLDYRDRKSIGI